MESQTVHTHRRMRNRRRWAYRLPRLVPFLPWWLYLAALIYSAIFPLTNLAGGDLAEVGIAVTTPFIAVAWGGGLLLVGILRTEHAYLLGFGLAVFAQVVLLMSLAAVVFRKCRDGA